jgi:hypothetical protein
MGSFQTAGNTVTQRNVFNTGTIDFGGNRLVDIDNITLSIEWSTMGLYVLNSIKPQDLVRHTQKITMSGKAKSFPAELVTTTLGSSASGTPNEIDTLDGQATLQNPVVTLFDRENREIQYQFSGALFKSSKLTAANEAYAEFDFDLEAMDIAILYKE